MKKYKRPILKCYPIGDGLVKAWCPFCNKWHIHGYPEKIKSGDIGHRVAHCINDESPFDITGYDLYLISKKDINEIARAIDYYESKNGD